MYRVVFLFCVLLLIATTSVPAYAHPDAPSRPPAEWTKGYTLVLVDASSPAQLAETREFIVAQGGTVAVTLPPHAIFGWITPDVAAKILGKHGIRSIHRSTVDAAAVPFTDRETRLAVNLFNDIASGRTARRIKREANHQPGPELNRPGMIGCAEPRPALDRNNVLRNLRALGAEQSASKFSPQFLDNSNVMDGTVTVAVFLIESNGGVDPNVYTWSAADQAFAFAQVLDGLTWWVDQSRAFQLGQPLQFNIVTYDASNPACQVPYEPILHSGSDAGLWINQIMANVGVTSGSQFDRVGAFDQAMREQHHSAWAFSIFMAYNPLPAPTAFRDNRASWAYIGGPHQNVLFRSFGWPLARIISHETGHIFYACDEYYQPGYQICSCTCAPEVRPQALNTNCQDASCTQHSTDCMMRLNELALCPFTVAQIGWTAAQPKPIPTAPQSLAATASSPTQVNLVWADTSTVEDGFQIERRGGSSAEFTQIAVVTANTITYSDPSALSNTAYAYRVRAFNNSGTSSYSAEAPVITPTVAPRLSVGTTDMPEATVGVPYSRTLVANGGKADYAWIIDSGSLPAGLTLSQSGSVAGTPTTAGTSVFVVRVTDSESSSATKALTLIVKPSAPLTITTGQLPRGSVGTTYSQNLGASGGQTPYTWSRDSGSFPDGISLNQSTGVISGTPERSGSSSFVIKLTDATNTSVTATLSITINPAISALTIMTESLADGVVGEDYSQTLHAEGGNIPYRWAISTGKLPDGLQLSEGGVISGKPTTSGETQFQLRVTDPSGQVATVTLSIDIDPAPELTILSQNPLPLAAVGVPYRQELKATSGKGPYTWDKKKKKKFGAYPDGITLSGDGVLSGTPTAQGVSNFTIRVTDSQDNRANKPLSIEVGPPPPPLAITTESLPQATQSLSYTTKLAATGGIGPYTWSLDTGALPDGLTLATDGTITGRPNVAGTTTFTVRLKDSLGTSSVKSFFITVLIPPPPLVIQTQQLPETSAERPYTQTLQVTGGVPPYTWSLVSGNLGEGLNLSANGVISGTPVAPGTSVFVVRATDSAQQSISRTLAIVIKPADKLAPFGNLETPDFRATLSNTATGSGWALDNVGVAAIEVIVDGHKVSDGIYGLSRPDIGAVWSNFQNAAHSGFSFAFDTTTLTNGDHTLSVRLLDAAGNVTVIGTRPFVTQNNVLAILTTSLPRGKKGDPYSQQLQAANGRPPYTWTLVAGALPSGLSLNAAGVISGTPTVFGSNFTFTVRVTDTINVSAVASFALTINADIEPLRVISNGNLTAGLTGVDYTQQLFFAGGHPPVQWSLAGGTLPLGLSLNATTGIISGRPRAVGSFTFTARVSDSQSATAVSSPLIIEITAGPLGVIETGTLTQGATGAVYSQALLGTGGTLPYTWAVNSGTLPPGLLLNASTGAITGIPITIGTYDFVIKLTDSATATALSDPLRIVVVAGPLSVTSLGDLTAGHVNVDYTHQLTANGGVKPYTWSLVTGTLPTGLTLDTVTGVISGKPTAAGTFTFTVRVRDALNVTATSAQLRIIISP